MLRQPRDDNAFFQTQQWFSASFPAQIANRLRIIRRAEDRRAGDENLRAVFDRDLRRFRLDSAVDFDVELAAVRIAPFFCAPYFFHHLGPERLATEAGMHGHDEKEIDGGKVRRDGFERRGGIQS